MEKNESNKKLLYCIAVLIVLTIGLSSYIVYDKIANVPSKNTLKKDEDKITEIESTLPSDLQAYEYPMSWDYKKIYNEYSQMNEDNDSIIGVDEFDFVEIRDNKLFWRVNNEWIIDNTIKEDIFYMYFVPGGEIESILVVTKNNNIYEMAIRFYDDILWQYVENLHELKSLDKKDYEKISYKKIDFNGEIDKVSAKSFPVECDGYEVFYLKSDNIIYMLLDGNLLNIDDYFKNIDIVKSLGNTCYGKITEIKIDFNGESNILDSNGKKIKVKQYIYLQNYLQNEELNLPIYNIIIDENNKLYSFTNDNFNEDARYKPIDGNVVEYELKEDVGENHLSTIFIKLDNGKTINIGQK